MDREKPRAEHLVERVVEDDLCMGCGMCVASSSKARIKLAYHGERDQFLPIIEHRSPDAGDDPDVVCPGIDVDMRALSEKRFGKQPDDHLLGVYEQVRVAYAADPGTRERAASGGIVPAVLRHLFDTNAIDLAYALVPGKGPYDAKGRILRSSADLEQIHGSCYHPFDFGFELRELVEGEGRFAFVGLPCQIAGLEMMKAKRPELAARHVLSIGLFCGGVNKFKAMAYYLEGHGIPWKDVEEIEYRRGTWPGKMRVQRRSTGEEVSIPRIEGNSRWQILRYTAAFQGFWMLKRCRICPDQIADFADIAVGDPHVPKYRGQKTPGFSLVVTRTPRGEALTRALVENGLLVEEPASPDLITESQKYTLDNRRHAPAYARVARLLGERAPEMTTYPGVEQGIRFRHYKYAAIDLLKILLGRGEHLRRLYASMQAFDYLFLTFYPSLFVKRLRKLLSNDGGSR